MIEILVAFTFKHFLCDFMLQNAYMARHKGTYGHIGGIEHALIHFVGTALIALYFGFDPILAATIDAVTHYHIDWLKMNVNKRYNLKYEHYAFWVIVGLDQMLHFLTYIFIVWWI